MEAAGPLAKNIGPERTEAIRAQLARILEAPEFEATERLRDFLSFVVEESLAGRAAGIRAWLLRAQRFSAVRLQDDGCLQSAGRVRGALE